MADKPPAARRKKPPGGTRRPRATSRDLAGGAAKGLAEIGVAATAGAIAAPITPTMAVGALAVAIPGAILLAMSSVWNARQWMLQRWWEGVCNDPSMTPEQAKAEYEWKAANDADAQRVVLEQVQALLLADQVVVSSLAALGQEYFQRGAPDRFFRGMVAVLSSVSKVEFYALRQIFRQLAEYEPDPPGVVRLQFGLPDRGGRVRLCATPDAQQFEVLYLDGGNAEAGPGNEHGDVLFHLLRTHRLGEERLDSGTLSDANARWSGPPFFDTATVRRIAAILAR